LPFQSETLCPAVDGFVLSPEYRPAAPQLGYRHCDAIRAAVLSVFGVGEGAGEMVRCPMAYRF